MKYFRIFPVFLFCASAALAAGNAVADCRAELQAFAPNLTSATSSVDLLPAEVLEEVMKLYREASSYCANDQEAEALRQLDQAKALLGVQ